MQPKHHRRLIMEPLESRWMLAVGLISAAGLVPVGQQPIGALSGKIVYTHGGHGWTADNLGNGAWTLQRPKTFEMVEDLGNQDQMTFFVDYLFNAGATVVPLRPVGHQPNEVILDNDDPAVEFLGTWSNSSASIYFGDPGDVPYRYASTSATETARARYRPNIPEAGFYPVYAWTRAGSDRAADQLYRIHHTGGITEVTINHRRVGNGPIYLGRYYFDAGTGGYVDISNRSSESGRVVIADMIRFGNGMGDIDRGGGVSNQPREDESGLYWVQWHVDHSQGISNSEYRVSTSDRSATVSFSPRYAEYMNREADGTLSDRVFVSFHSNAGGGSARGVLGLYNGNNTPASATPNQASLAEILATEINVDLVAQNGRFEHDWHSRSTVTLDRGDIEFGEINNAYINNEFDATIMETGFHDNREDAEMLRDPRVRDALARATYQGLVKYFNSVDSGMTPVVMLPNRVTDVRAESSGAESVTVSWSVPVANGHDGDAPSGGFLVYASIDGYGFDGGTHVPEGTTRHTFSGLVPANGMYYFRVVAINEGGQSLPSEVVAAMPNSQQANVLIVNGFDRLERRLNPRLPLFGGEVDRVQPQRSNSRDYVVQVGQAVEAYDDTLTVDATSNEAVISGAVDLNDYMHVIWILGEESSADNTLDNVEQTLVAAFLSGGGNLMISGAEIGWDLDHLQNGRAFYNNTLRADYVADDANTYQASGASGSIFAGLNVEFDDGTLFYDSQYPDVLQANAGSAAAMTYVGGRRGTAAVVFDNNGESGGRIVMFGFPFETITTELNRNAVMERVLQFFDVRPILLGDFNDDGQLDCSDVEELSMAITSGSTQPRYDVDGSGVVDVLDLHEWIVNIKGTLLGDANLDYVVDGIDFNIWNENRFANSTTWCQGDFNGNGVTNGNDFNIWNSHRFTSVTPPSASVAAEVPPGYVPRAPASLVGEDAGLHRFPAGDLVGPRTLHEMGPDRSVRHRPRVNERQVSRWAGESDPDIVREMAVLLAHYRHQPWGDMVPRRGADATDVTDRSAVDQAWADLGMSLEYPWRAAGCMIRGLAAIL